MTSTKTDESPNWKKYISISAGIIYTLLGILLMWNETTYFSRIDSFWDYEGFSLGFILNFMGGILMLLFGIYFIRNGGMIDGYTKSTKNVKIGFVLLGCFLGFGIQLISTWFNNADYKYQLPLNNIQTTEIIGTTINHVSLSFNVDNSADQKDINEYCSNVAIHGGLAEFPGIRFKFPSNNHLKIDREYVQDKGSARINELLNKQSKLPAGTEVKLKIRTTDYYEIMNSITSGDNLKKNRISFYELVADDVLLVRKLGIE